MEKLIIWNKRTVSKERDSRKAPFPCWYLPLEMVEEKEEQKSPVQTLVVLLVSTRKETNLSGYRGLSAILDNTTWKS